MQNYIRKRAVKVAQYIIKTSNTVRQTAEVGNGLSAVIIL
jgi:putative DeoR family transcriptional regulator (stage III sporulation protein D)